MSRSRKGCTTCKKRHRKCDETKPICLQCEANGLDCQGYGVVLRWDNGVASRGRLKGASIPVDTLSENGQSKRNPPRDMQPNLITKSRRHRQIPSPRQIVASEETPDSTYDASGLIPSPCIQPEQDSMDGLSLDLPVALETSKAEQDTRLFKEFTERTIFALYSTNTDDAFCSRLCQLASESEALRSILIAAHLYITNPESPSALFEEYYNRSLRLFRRQLEWYDGTLSESIMLAGLFVCTINLFQATPWSIHLEHMMKVYGFMSDESRTSRLADMHLQYPIEVMAVMDLPTFVRGRSTTTLGIWKRLREEQVAWPSGKTTGTEAVSGLPRSLLDIFSTIEDYTAENAFLAWSGEVGEVPQCHLWEAYRIAGVLVSRRLRRKRSSTYPQSPTTEILVARLIAAMDALCDTRRRPEYRNSLASNASIYPYAAARLEVAVLLEKPAWVRNLRRCVDICGPYGNTANARKLEEMLDEALESSDDCYDIDSQARLRNVEISLL